MKYLSKTIEYGLYFLVFLLPLQTRWIIKPGELNNGPWEYGTYSLYGTDILLIIILALFIIREITALRLAITEKKTGNSKIIWWFIGGLILVSAVSSAGAADKPLALYKLSWLILGLGLFWLIIRANYDRLKLIYAMLTGVFLSAGLGIWQFFNQVSFASKWLGLAFHQGANLGAAVIEAVGADGIGERWLRAYGSLDHPNIFGGLLAAAIIFLIGEMITEKRFRNFFIMVNWFLLSVFMAAIFFSFSRAGWLALGAGLAVTAVSAVASRNLRWQKGLAEIILIMGILLLVLFSQYQNLVFTRLNGAGRLENKSNFERLASYQEAWQLIKNNWLLGVGPGNYTLALRQEISPDQDSYYYQPAHNVFMLVWAEAGIFGVIFFTGLIIFLFVRLPRRPEYEISDNDNSGFNQRLPLLAMTMEKSVSRHSKIFCNSSQTAILIALIILMLLDHWLFSLHFGGLFFWLVLGLIYRKESRDN